MVHLILAVEIVDGEFIFTIDEMVTQATARVDVQLFSRRQQATAGDSTGGRARSLRKRKCQSPVERDAATERDCVSAFASRDWTVVAKGAIRVRFHSLVFVSCTSE